MSQRKKSLECKIARLFLNGAMMSAVRRWITKRLSAKQCNELMLCEQRLHFAQKIASARARERLQASQRFKKGIEDWGLRIDEQKSPTHMPIEVSGKKYITPSIGLLFSRYRSDHSREHFMANKPCWAAALHYLITFAFQKTWTQLVRTADRVSATAADPCYLYLVCSYYSS